LFSGEQSRSGGNQVSVAFVLYNSAEIFRRQKQYDEALARLREAQQQFQSLGEKSGLTEATVEVARVLLEAGRLEEAAPEIEASLLLARETGQRRREMYALDLKARLLARQGSWTEARAAFRAAEKIARSIGDPKTIAELLWHCGESLPSQERHTDAYLLLSVAARELKALELAPDCAEVHTLLKGLREKLGSEVEGLDEMSISLLPEGLFDRL
jgi:tetratricopeptide (TPR) repeat protein